MPQWTLLTVVLLRDSSATDYRLPSPSRQPPTNTNADSVQERTSPTEIETHEFVGVAYLQTATQIVVQRKEERGSSLRVAYVAFGAKQPCCAAMSLRLTAAYLFVKEHDHRHHGQQNRALLHCRKLLKNTESIIRQVQHRRKHLREHGRRETRKEVLGARQSSVRATSARTTQAGAYGTKQRALAARRI